MLLNGVMEKAEEFTDFLDGEMEQQESRKFSKVQNPAPEDDQPHAPVQAGGIQQLKSSLAGEACWPGGTGTGGKQVGYKPVICP